SWNGNASAQRQGARGRGTVRSGIGSSQRRTLRPGYKQLVRRGPHGRSAMGPYGDAAAKRQDADRWGLVRGRGRQWGAVRFGRQHLVSRRFDGHAARLPYGDVAARRQGADRGGESLRGESF